MKNLEDRISQILSRIKTGTPLTVTNKARLKIWIKALYEEIADEQCKNMDVV